MGSLALTAAFVLDRPLVDPEDFLGPSWLRLPLLVLGAFLLDVLPRTLWGSRMKPALMPAIARERVRTHWDKDRIVLTENLGASGSGTSAQNAAVAAILTAAGFPTVGAARFFINGLDTRTQGVDAVLNWRLPVDFGKFNFTAAYNYNKQNILKYNNDLGPLATIPGLVLFGRTESLRFTKGQPRDKIVLSMDGDIGSFGFTARTTRYGRVLSPGSVAPLAPNAASLTALGPDDVSLSPKWITDLELRYDLRKDLHLAVGADNVFDVYPDRLPYGLRPTSIGGSYPQNNQYNAYSIFSPFGFNGRFLYARVGFDF